MIGLLARFFFFFFNDTATTEIYTLSLHDALPILLEFRLRQVIHFERYLQEADAAIPQSRSEEHTSELQSPCNLVCRLLLEKKKKRFSSLLKCALTIRHIAHSTPALVSTRLSPLLI